jgi:energy-coupling factor transporter ATP-binding protein EcfA2
MPAGLRAACAGNSRCYVFLIRCLHAFHVLVGRPYTVEDFCWRLETNETDIQIIGLGLLRLERKSLVNLIVEMASDRRKHVLLRGPNGAGKTTLLMYAGRELEKMGHRVLIATDPQALPSATMLLDYAWGGRPTEMPEDMRRDPLYLFVDEARESYGPSYTSSNGPSYRPSVLQELFQSNSGKTNIVIVAAGSPEQACAPCSFIYRIELDKLLLSAEELCHDTVVEFFAQKLAAASSKGREVPAVVTPSERATKLATKQVLKFAHYYTAGHTFACLKIAEYCVNELADECYSTRPYEELGLAIGCKGVLNAAVGEIFPRSYPMFSDFRDVINLQCRHTLDNKDVECFLQKHGFWDETRQRLQSPLLQLFLFHLMPKWKDFVFADESYIGNALHKCICGYPRWDFSRYERGSQRDRDRCVNGVGFYIVCELAKYCTVSPQQVTANDQPRPLSADDYYLNNDHVDMFLVVVNSGSPLEEHFDRFLGGGYGGKNAFAVLVINFDTDKPRMLAQKYAAYENAVFTYVVRTQELFCGRKLFKPERQTTAGAPTAR